MQQGSGLGSALLGAWLAVADQFARECWLQVLPDNPARPLYQRLGFAIIGAPDTPTQTMRRPVGG